MIYTVERIEGQFILLEDENGLMSERLLADFPIPVEEGDKLEETERGIIVREDLKQSALVRNRALFERLRKKKRGSEEEKA